MINIFYRNINLFLNIIFTNIEIQFKNILKTIIKKNL